MIIDCVLHYGGADIDLLKLRLKEHTFVDLFIVCEITTDFHGNEKYTHENEITHLSERYNIAYNKAHINHSTPFEMAVSWRNSLKTLMDFHGANDNDTIIFTDLDEILNASKWNYTPDMGLMAVETKLYYYYFNLFSGEMWTNGFVAPYGSIKDKNISDLRYNYTRRKYDTGLLRDAGWHFAWLGGKEVIKDKYRNFGQAEGWNPALASDEYIDHILKDRILFTDSRQLEIVPIDNSFPTDLRQNVINYSKYLFEFEK